MAMQTKLLLLDGITATAATKVAFELTLEDFKGSSLPALKSRGLGTGDSILIWEWVNGDWQDTGQVLDENTTSSVIRSMGRYAVTAVMATAGPVSCELHSSAMRPV